MGNAKSKLTAHEVRLVSVHACVDPRTLRSYFEGRAYSTTSARIEGALVKLGYTHLIHHHSPDDLDIGRLDVIA